MHTQQPELRVCPFCGSNNVSVQNLDEETSVVACDNCNANGGYYGGTDSTSPAEAIAAWNARASDHRDEALTAIMRMLDPDSNDCNECIRADDPETAMDTAYECAKRAINPPAQVKP